MNCKEFETLVPEFINKKMDYGRTKMFMEHFKVCNQCKEELNIQFLVNEGLMRLEDGEAFDLQKEIHDLLGCARKKIRVHEKFLSWGKILEGFVIIVVFIIIGMILLV